MSKINNNITDLIGKTPLLALDNLAKKHNAKARLIGKLESFNPAASVKDRLAHALIEDAKERGLLKEGAIIVEPTSGNTGIGLASIAAAMGIKCILTMPDTMSIERRNLLKIFGAELVLTPGAKGMKGAVEKAEEIAASTPNAFIPGQFTNPANVHMHYKTTGPEIWEDSGGNVDIFVSGIGTGGTISGAGAYLKEKNPSIKIIAVEPKESPVLSGGSPSPHKIQGIGAGFVPDVLDTDIYDDIIAVSGQDAIEMAKDLAKTQGLLAGISSGAALWAALQLASSAENEGKTIVAVLPDTGERYLSTDMFAHLKQEEHLA